MCLTLGETTKLFSKVHVLLHTYFPEQYVSCTTSHCQQHLLMQQVVLHYGFNLHFSGNK